MLAKFSFHRYYILLWTISLPFTIATKLFSQPWSDPASNYSFKHYQIENGLSDNTIYSSLQDKLGFLWFGTRDGLNRFDGHRFRRIQLINKEGLKPLNNHVTVICEDGNGMLWLGGVNGLYRYDIASDHIEQLLDSIGYVNDIKQDADNNLWIIANGKMYVHFNNSNTIKPFAAQQDFRATTLLPGKDHSIWIGTTNGFIYQYETIHQTFKHYDLYRHSPVVAIRDIQKMQSFEKDHIIIGTREQGIKLFDIRTHSYTDVLTQNRDKTPLFVRDIVERPHGEFWFGTESGLLIIDFTTNKTTWVTKQENDPFGLSGNAIYTMCNDDEGGIWLGTYFAGVNYYSYRYSAFRNHFSQENGTRFGDHVVREIRPDDNKGLWVGTEDNGLYYFSFAANKFTWQGSTEPAVGMSSKNIHGLLPDGNYLWIGNFEYGLDRMDVRTHNVVKHYESRQNGNQFISNFVVTLLKSSGGERFAGTANGVYRYNPVKDQFDSIPGFPAGRFIYALVEDSDGLIWIGSQQGVYYYQPTTGKVGELVSAFPILKTSAITSVLEDSKKQLWFTSEENGVFRYNKKTEQLKHFEEHNGLSSNYTFKILEDRHGDMWVSTNRGLCRLNNNGQASQFTTANGLLSDQFNYNSGYYSDSGTLFFGSLKGLLAIRPEILSGNNNKKKIYFTGLQINNNDVTASSNNSPLKKSIVYSTAITVPHYQSTLSFDFAALSYYSPEMTQYRYRLEGLDQKWTDLPGNRRIYFTNLSEGKYRLVVQASTGNGWNGPTCMLSVRVLPPFWATWWAFILYGSFISLLAYYFYTAYSKAAMVKREKEVFDAKMEFFTNVAHEVKTPLTLIKLPLDKIKENSNEYPLIQGDIRTMEKNTNRLFALIQQILDLRKTEIGRFTLNFKKTNLTQLQEEILAQYKAYLSSYHIRCDLQFPHRDVLIDADEEAMRKILTNLTDNAIKHADQSVKISCHLFIQNNMVTLVFENDGETILPEVQEKIFEPFYSHKNTKRSSGTGIGLALVQSFAGLHNGNVQLEKSEPGSTRFVLQLPIEQNKHTHEGPLITGR